MRSYQGSVFYVDILGFSSLTRGEINNLKSYDFEAWGLNTIETQNHSFLAATILLEFRNSLLSLCKKYSNIKVSQLSDCAFIYSEDKYELIKAVHFFMWDILENKCILCRGGIAHGEIVEVDNIDKSLGDFIVGEAVSKAVKNESKLKGPRISMDESFGQDFWNYVPEKVIGRLCSFDLLYNVHSLINGEDVDEYRWYLFDDDDFGKNISAYNQNERVKLTKKRLKLGYNLYMHPRFGWNTKSDKGLLQMNIGMEVISASDLLLTRHSLNRAFVIEGQMIDNNKNHDFSSEENTRSFEGLKKWGRIIDNEDYQKI